MNLLELSEVHGRPWDDVDVSIRTVCKCNLVLNSWNIFAGLIIPQ